MADSSLADPGHKTGLESLLLAPAQGLRLVSLKVLRHADPEPFVKAHAFMDKPARTKPLALLFVWTL